MNQRIFDVREAQSSLECLVEMAAAGEEILIAKDGMPVARLMPTPKAMRRFGGLRGHLWLADDFDESLKDPTDARG